MLVNIILAGGQKPHLRRLLYSSEPEQRHSVRALDRAKERVVRAQGHRTLGMRYRLGGVARLRLHERKGLVAHRKTWAQVDCLGKLREPATFIASEPEGPTIGPA